MLTLEECRRIDTSTKHLSDEELTKLRGDLYVLVDILFDHWLSQKGLPNQNLSSNIPLGSCPEGGD